MWSEDIKQFVGKFEFFCAVLTVTYSMYCFIYILCINTDMDLQTEQSKTVQNMRAAEQCDIQPVLGQL